ncbi:MAG TPA: M13 family metallopeptidase [Acidobacteriaceae bacterium]|jgi:putative endopeptidase|nr:M13 family metallopeptidase [Acidobacteriaceae bacterium]
MSETTTLLDSKRTTFQRALWRTASAALVCLILAPVALAQQTPAPAKAAPAPEKPLPGLDLSSMDLSADPCTDMYKYACGNFNANHPIPADQPDVDPFYVLYNVTTQELNGILTKAAAGGATRSPDEQKIGDFFSACMDTSAIDAAGLKPIQPLLDDIDSLSTPAPKVKLAALLGELQRDGVDALFGYGEQQDLKDATKQIAFIQQGGLGMPEKDYYLRTGDKDVQLRAQYVAHVAKMLTLAGSTPEQAKQDAQNIMTLETALAKASLGVVDLREPEKTYHLQPIAAFEANLPGVNFQAYQDAIHSPRVTEINNSTPDYLPEMLKQIRTTPTPTLQAYLRYHLLTTFARELPHAFDEENFDFYGRILRGQPEQQQRWKRCSNTVNGSIGEALGKVYVDQYFAGDSKAKMLVMVHDIETAMGQDIDQITWMSPATKTRAREKLAAVANKIGYPDKWRDYSRLTIAPTDGLGNEMRANAFENDRQLNKIGKPVDKAEWEMTPPTINAYYDDSMNNINFPAGILQPPFYDRAQDDAVNYGHIGAVIGHELTHGFDDEGRKFDALGNLDNWWTADDLKNFTTRTDCEVNEYSSFTAVDDVHINGKLTLGENTADNGGLMLAFMAYMQRAKDNHIDTSAKVNGFTGPQRFYIGFAQNWCQNVRPEAVREQVLQDPHSPDRFRVNGVIVNQPGFAPAFGCKQGAPMVPVNSCRVW